MFKHKEIDIVEAVAKSTPNGRMYETPDGSSYPSVTTVMSYMTQDSIKAWRARVGEEEANKISNQAATRGTKIHDLCEQILLNEEVSYDKLSLLDKEMFFKFKPLLDRINNIHALETALYSHHLRLAGRVDCIAEFDGKLCVIDFKTSRKPKRKSWIDNYFMQCTAYAIMFEEMTKIPIPTIALLICVEGDDPQVFIEKRDNYAEKLLDLRLDYERSIKL